MLIMRYTFQCHDYDINTAACEESCDLWIQDLANDDAAVALLNTYAANAEATNQQLRYSAWATDYPSDIILNSTS